MTVYRQEKNKQIERISDRCMIALSDESPQPLPLRSKSGRSKCGATAKLYPKLLIHNDLHSVSYSSRSSMREQHRTSDERLLSSMRRLFS